MFFKKYKQQPESSVAAENVAATPTVETATQSAATQSAGGIQVRHTSAAVHRAEHFLISASNEEILIEFSSGPQPATEGDGVVMPIETRSILSWESAARLHHSLTRLLAARYAESTAASNQQQKQVRRTPAPHTKTIGAPVGSNHAALPGFTNANSQPN